MAFTPEERQAWQAAVQEIAGAVNDRVIANTAQLRQAAQQRFISGMLAYTLVIMNAHKHGTQGDYN
jgi:hypothetical protein